jgi:hypothetical protein
MSERGPAGNAGPESSGEPETESKAATVHWQVPAGARRLGNRHGLETENIIRIRVSDPSRTGSPVPGPLRAGPVPRAIWLDAGAWVVNRKGKL